eukprot:maker-scaffold_11-snap-gene-12.17-mRNA-1 protein AED:0.20 eAED:0.20 QI:0/0/0/1/0/0/2/0/931
MKKVVVLVYSVICLFSQLCFGGRLGINVDLENNNNGVSVGEAKELFRTVEDYLGFESNGKVDTLRLFNFDSSVTELITSFLSLENLNEIYLGIQNNQLSGFRRSFLEEFQSTVSTITDTRPDISLTFVVGDEPFLNGFDSSDVEATVDVLKDNYPQVPVIIPCSMGTLSVSFPVESGQFSNDFISSYSSVLTKVDAFGVNPYPFYTIFDDESITLETTAGEDMQMLTQQLQATQAALARENLNLELVVTATGWPSFGSNEFATPENNYQYFSNVARFALDEQTSSGLFDHLFLQELVDQPLKDSDAQQDAFGIFDSEGNFKIIAPTNQPTFLPTTIPSKNPTPSPTKFPTRNPSKSPTPVPTPFPTLLPTAVPSSSPSTSATPFPSEVPDAIPSFDPTEVPFTSSPTNEAGETPTISPNNIHSPTLIPTGSPVDVAGNGGQVDSNLIDTNLLLLASIATQAALARENLNLELVVTATGWPSFGNNEFATPENNYQYFSNVAQFALDERASSGLFNHLFLQELVDQPLKDSDAEQDAFGIFDSEGNFKIIAPTNQPTFLPTTIPSKNPTPSPTKFPTRNPSKSPTPAPTPFPTLVPTASPSKNPTPNPTKFPTRNPSKSPTPAPTPFPTLVPTASPSKNPTPNPTNFPTRGPTHSPTPLPTPFPTLVPTSSPTTFPSSSPTRIPTFSPTLFPTSGPIISPTPFPSSFPTLTPTSSPIPKSTLSPTPAPSDTPTASPTLGPTPEQPTLSPTNEGDDTPTPSPSYFYLPTLTPTSSPVEISGNEGQNNPEDSATDVLLVASSGGLFLLAIVLGLILVRSRLKTRNRKRYLKTISQKQRTFGGNSSGSGSMSYMDFGIPTAYQTAGSLNSVGSAPNQPIDHQTSHGLNSSGRRTAVHYRFQREDEESVRASLPSPPGLLPHMHNSNPLYANRYSN